MTTIEVKKDLGGEERKSREERREIAEERALSDEERLKVYNDYFYQAVLPNIPKIPGYHVCWLSTQNQRDNLHSRMRLGYTPVKPEDIPGWEFYTLRTGEYVGMIGVNEMVAFKIPLSLYEKYIMETHYNAPNREDERLVSDAESMRQNARSSGSNLYAGEGFSTLLNDRPKPNFENLL
jgi:hypothetical protein